MAVVSLCEITAETVRAICALSVSPEQQRFVASNALSIAQAHFSDKAWFRAIHANRSPVGFIMLFDDAEKPLYYIWRLMIVLEHQRKGYARRAVELCIEYVRTRPGATELFVSYAPGVGDPGAFYRKLGFELTGEEDDGQLVMRLGLSALENPASRR